MRVILPPRYVCIFALLVLVLGLITSFAPPQAAAQNSTSAAVHVVGWGETLYSIARIHGVSPDTIIAANALDAPDHLYAGQSLIIPGTGPAAAPQVSSNVTYVVQPGDGLYRIAVDHGIAVDALMAANGLSNPDQIYAGQVLVIPGANSASPAPTSTPSTTSGPGGIHVVQPGETLFRISQQHGVTVDALVATNGLLSPSQIYAGQQLIVPGPGAAPAALPELTGTHIVQPGESLGTIAAQYGVSMATLAQANNISNPSLIYTGQRLVVPSAGTSGPATQANGANPGVHIVQRGETLFRISVRYGVSVSDLMAANGLTDGSTIYTGQRLAIPGGSGGPAVTPEPVVIAPPPTITNGKQIVVQLSTQRVFAYENGQLQREFIVSTGLPATPTVTGDYTIYVKYATQHMAGPGYNLPNVPWVMYFYRGYGFHGTYWHNNFGQPMSHGCVNMRTADAEWLYAWASIGTAVHVGW